MYALRLATDSVLRSASSRMQVWTRPGSARKKSDVKQLRNLAQPQRCQTGWSGSSSGPWRSRKQEEFCLKKWATVAHNLSSANLYSAIMLYYFISGNWRLQRRFTLHLILLQTQPDLFHWLQWRRCSVAGYTQCMEPRHFAPPSSWNRPMTEGTRSAPDKRFYHV